MGEVKMKGGRNMYYNLSATSENGKFGKDQNSPRRITTKAYLTIVYIVVPSLQ